MLVAIVHVSIGYVLGDVWVRPGEWSVVQKIGCRIYEDFMVVWGWVGEEAGQEW